MTPVPDTPAKKQSCDVPKCKKAPKGFKTSQGLKGHMKKFHDIVSDALSPARVLFTPETPSVQGNSKGQVSMVVTEGIFQCGKCTEQFKTRDEVKNHMDEKHDKVTSHDTIDEPANNDKGDKQVEDYDNAKADEPNDNLDKTSKGNKAADNDNLNTDIDDEEDLAALMEDIEDSDIANGLETRAAANKIVETFVEMAFREMHPSQVTSNTSCHECMCKDENLVKLDKLLSEKDAQLEEKSATIRGLMDTMRKNVKTRAAMQKKVDQVDKVKKKLADKQNENARLRTMVETKEALVEVQTTTARLMPTTRLK